MKTKILTLIGFFMLTGILSPGNAHAQLGKIAKFAGRQITTAVISSVVDKQVEKMFYSGNERNRNTYDAWQSKGLTSVTVHNNLYAVTYFWVTTDGQNWKPYVLHPGYHFNVSAPSGKKVGIFNGYDVRIVTGGQYYSSQFFQ